MLEEKKRQKPGPKPKRSARRLLYDQFSDFSPEEQAIVLEFLSELHYQAKRQASKRWSIGPDILGEASVRAMEEQGRIDGMDGTPK